MSARPSRIAVYAALTLTIASIEPWRTETYFTGQGDWVVLAKAGLLIGAFLIALLAKGSVKEAGGVFNIVSATALLVSMLYFACSVAGAVLFGNFVATAALSIRALMVCFILLALFELFEPLVVIDALSRILAMLAVFMLATGSFVGVPARLTGTIPPIPPNEIAFCAAVPLIYFVWRLSNQKSNILGFPLICVLGLVIFLTQSRTSAAAVALVTIYLVIRGSSDWRIKASLLIAAGLCLVFIVALTRSIEYFASRGNSLSLNSVGVRTIAWSAVLNSDRSPLKLLLGEGLAAKHVPVQGQYWKTQLLDSSWISAFVQAGVVGLVLCVLLVIYAASQAMRALRPIASLYLALVVMVTVRSIFESGLLDSSLSFLTFMAVALGASTRSAGEDEPSGHRLTSKYGIAQIAR